MSSVNNRFYAPLHDSNVNPELWLFPGVLAIVLGALAIFSRERRSVVIALTWVAIGFVGSLGLHTFFHRFLFTYVPGFRAIRVPARWAVIAYVGLAMLVALATAMIARRRIWITPMLAAVFLIELHAAPIGWYMAQTTVPPVERWIAAARPRALIELPRIAGREYQVVFASTAHHRPIVNGVSGFTPPEYERVTALTDSWSDALARELARIGVSHIVVHADVIDASGRAWLARALARHEISFVRRFDGGVRGDWVFTIGGPSRTSPELDAMLRGEPTYSEMTTGML
ncbi:MAG TPA: hypothetical protein VGA33_11650, partial [Thermoanaerobaculia bacterium]